MRSLLLVIFVWLNCAHAQEVLSLKQVEDIFYKQNLLLIAEKYGVEVDRAAIVQSGLWINPELNINQLFYNPQTKRHLDMTDKGQTDISLVFTIPLAGKIQKAVDVAKARANSKQEGFIDTIRILRKDLRSTYFDLHFKAEILKFYDQSLDHLRQTLSVVEKNFDLGNITSIEMMRIRSVVFKVEGERKRVFNEYIALNNQMSLFLGTDALKFSTIMPASILFTELPKPILNVDEAIAQASLQRPDLKSLESLLASHRMEEKLERAVAYPNLKLGGQWDRHSNYTDNYQGLLISFDVPIFDRNQGNIQAAVARKYSTMSRLEHLRVQIRNEVKEAFNKFTTNQEVFSKYKSKFQSGFTKIVEVLNNNYQKRYISSLEFSDSFDALRETAEMFLQLQIDRFSSAEELNNAVGKEQIDLRNLTSET